MIVKSFEIVINNQYGGFSFDREMAEWLHKNKNWGIAGASDFPQDDLIAPCLIQWSGDLYYPVSRLDNVELRLNPDLIECVKTLRAKYEDQLQPGHKLRNKVLDLVVQKVNVEVDVEDVHDGKERVIVTHYPK